jgi:alpha-L-fucosidase 2
MAGIDASAVTAYRRELDIGSAVAGTAFTAGRTSFTREYFVSHPDHLVIVRLTASEPGSLSLALCR